MLNAGATLLVVAGRELIFVFRKEDEKELEQLWIAIKKQAPETSLSMFVCSRLCVHFWVLTAFRGRDKDAHENLRQGVPERFKDRYSIKRGAAANRGSSEKALIVYPDTEDADSKDSVTITASDMFRLDVRTV